MIRSQRVANLLPCALVVENQSQPFGIEALYHYQVLHVTWWMPMQDMLCGSFPLDNKGILHVASTKTVGAIKNII